MSQIVSDEFAKGLEAIAERIPLECKYGSSAEQIMALCVKHKKNCGVVWSGALIARHLSA